LKVQSQPLLGRLREERGIALVMALGIMLVLTIALTTTIFFTSASARDARRSNAGQKAYALAEEGVNNALAVLNSHYPSTSAYPGDTPPGTFLPVRTSSYADGSVTWSGTLQFTNGAGWTWEWAITSTGSVANPTGPGAAPITRTIHARVPVVMPPNQPVGSDGTLNWIYAGNNARFTQAVTLASPVYTWHSLSLENKAAISGAAGRLAVGGDPAAGGNLTLEQTFDTVGQDSPLQEVHIQGQCASQSVSLTLHACIWGDTPRPAYLRPQDPWNTDQIWGAVHDNTVPANLIVKPELTSSQMNFWYQNANLGPYIPCNSAGPGTPAFDTGDNTLNNSATPTTPFNLTPASGSYTCRNVVAGKTLGELSWDAAAKVLTLKGTIFLDGSATVDSTGYTGNPVFRYSGQGTLILSGTFAVKSAKICAVVSGSDCNTAAGAWDPNVNALVVVADGDGGAGGAQSQGNVVDPGNGIQIKGSSFQGALIADKKIKVETSSNEQGPMVSVYHDVESGQTGTLTFPAVHFAPSGGGGITQPVPPAKLLPPQNYAGG
jgi:hypothetical protein